MHTLPKYEGPRGFGKIGGTVLADIQLHGLLLHPGWVDYLILSVYFVFVVAVGVIIRRSVQTSGDFLLSGRSVPAWITGLAFLSANLGAQEMIGMGASGAKYGLMTSQFYWIGAIPAMAFVGVFMMPFYYGSKARSVPEYLKLRFDEKTRAVNALSFAVMTIFSSGISLYALAALMEILLGWNFHFSIFVSALIVLAYTFLGGLTAAIYNEVLQFFLIVLGFLPLTLLGLKDIGGWHGLVTQLNRVAVERGYPAGAWTHSIAGMGSPHENPMGVGWFSLVFGLGFVLSFGYWCTDFLVIQRALAADSLTAARRTPLIAAVPKMLLPALTVLPGMIAIGLTARVVHSGNGFVLPTEFNGEPNYNMAIPALLGHYFPQGLLGVGLTALMASFMSGMAGNVTAFNTVFTYDIYESYIRPGQPDSHYLRVGQFTTVAGIAISVATAYMASHFNNIMDLLQLVFAFVNAPLFATFLLGMFWRRTTGHGAFIGLLSGTTAAAIHHGMTLPMGQHVGLKGGWLLGQSSHMYPSEMAQSFWTAIWAFSACFVITFTVSLLTARTKSDEELKGLVYALTPTVHEEGGKWYTRPGVLGVGVVLAAAVLCVIFW